MFFLVQRLLCLQQVAMVVASLKAGISTGEIIYSEVPPNEYNCNLTEYIRHSHRISVSSPLLLTSSLVSRVGMFYSWTRCVAFSTIRNTSERLRLIPDHLILNSTAAKDLTSLSAHSNVSYGIRRHIIGRFQTEGMVLEISAWN